MPHYRFVVTFTTTAYLDASGSDAEDAFSQIVDLHSDDFIELTRADWDCESVEFLGDEDE